MNSQSCDCNSLNSTNPSEFCPALQFSPITTTFRQFSPVTVLTPADGDFFVNGMKDETARKRSHLLTNTSHVQDCRCDLTTNVTSLCYD